MATSPPLFPILPHSSDDGEMPTALDIPQPPPALVPGRSANDDPTAPDTPPFPLISIPAEPSENNIVSTALNTLNTPLPLIAPPKSFVKSKSFEQDIVVLSMTYVLAENPELKRLTDLIVAIHDKDEESQLTVVLNICARFSTQLAFASEAEAGETITHLIKTVEEISRINLEGNSQSDPLQALNCAVDEIVKFKVSHPQLIRDDNSVTSDRLSNVLNVIIGADIAALDIVKKASALVPIPWVRTAVGGVVILLNITQRRTNNDEIRQIATTAGQFVVSCAVACSDQPTELSDELKRALSQFTRTLEQITEDCDDISQRNAISPDLQQNAQEDALQGIRKRLDDAMKKFQTESQIPDIEDLSTKFDATSNDLPSHPRYLKDLTISCLPEDSTNPALQEMAVIIHGVREEDTVWTKMTATIWKYDGEIPLNSGMDGLTLSVQSEYAGDLGHVAFSPEELAAFMVIDGNLEQERNFIRLEEHTPLLQLTFTVVNASAGLRLPTESIHMGAHMLEGMQDPRMFTAKLGELAERPESLNAFGDLFRQQFYETSSEEDINRAVLAYKLAAALTPSDNANFALYVSDVGTSVLTRFELSGRVEDVNEAISMTEVAIAYTPQGHADMPAWLNNLGSSFQRRFERNGDLTDIASAISTQQRAIALTPEGHADMPGWLNNLVISFETRFERNGDLADIASAVSTQQRAIELTPEGHASMPALLNNLGNAFQARFERNGDLADIASAISTQQRVIALTPNGHADMPAWLNNLGISFQRRFERNGDLADIASAISTLQRAVALTPEGHANMPAWLNNLGISFQSRFERNGDLADIASAISMKQRAVELTPEGHANMPARLNNLGSSFQSRFERNGDLADIASAISMKQRAVELTPEGHAEMPARLSILGNAFQSRFERNGDLADIASAISMKQRAVELTPEGHAEMPAWLNNLGSSFQSRFERNGDLADIASAISMKQRAVELTPEGHAEMPARLNNLGNAFQSQFRTTHDMQHLQRTISIFSQSATQVAGNPSVRLTAARKWATLSRQAADKPESLRAFSVAIHLLPQVASLEHTIRKRHQTLVEVSDITASATAAAINDNQLEMAVAWLEQGRCLVWNQLNHLRTPVDDLHAYNPSLAGRFLHVARALEVSGSRQEQHAIFSKENATHMISLQEEAHNHVHLAKEWDKLLQEIRTIPEFEDFLLPPQLSKLLSRLPLDGPIIIFNIDESRCDALALVSGRGSPFHIPLDNFSLDNAIQLRDEIHKYLSNHRLRQRQEVDRDGDRLHAGGDTSMHNVLRVLWEHVAKPILDALGYSPNDSDPPRIWWCPTGPLSFLPIHAAGIYSNEKGTAGPCVSDYVVSSYTPTVSALLDKIEETPNMDDIPTDLLIISQPSTPGLNPIPGAEREAYAIKDMVASSHLLENASATVSKVKEEMKSHRWVHFACHAIQDAVEPLKSGVELHDGRLELSEMMQQTLPDAELAFLSACQTSTGNQDLSDEVVHLAAGMLAAGYRSVVGTMWSIKDAYGPDIAKDFYLNILGTNSEDGRRLDSGKAAGALHRATQNLRKKIGDTEEALLIWVPYVHFGF